LLGIKWPSDFTLRLVRQKVARGNSTSQQQD
jgi:hypothetical protein